MISDGCAQRDSAAIAAGVDARHLEDVLEQPGQTLDLGQNQVALLDAVRRRRARRLVMLLAATRIAVSGVRRSWPSDASSAVFNCSL